MMIKNDNIIFSWLLKSQNQRKHYTYLSHDITNCLNQNRGLIGSDDDGLQIWSRKHSPSITIALMIDFSFDGVKQINQGQDVT